ncbi:hypothetical protein C8F04DRAFT_1185299 [Mycena alexandri]|uniref:Uncharacterized protein n=1 Tax=Mycena alexandri TaxID=1745969 RepID=A0AAD6SUX5_9AGAR|nr:hypothetical protein C8F04DRAFT_1185299 [Mycena alexandri]
MPAGCPRLDPDIKVQHLQASRKSYDEKFLGLVLYSTSLKPSARHRATIAASDIFAQSLHRQAVAEHSCQYRAKKKAEDWAEVKRKEKVTRDKRRKEAEVLRKTSRKNAAANAAPKPPRKRTEHRAARSSSSKPMPSSSNGIHLTPSSRNERPAEDDSSGDDSGTLHPHTINPLLMRHWIEHEGGHFHPICTACYVDDCPGCKCVCTKSTVWKEHGGHKRILFQAPISITAPEGVCDVTLVTLALSPHLSFRLSISPPPSPGIPGVEHPGLCTQQLSPKSLPMFRSPSPILCPPLYAPALGAEDVDLETHTGTFYAVIADDWKGVAISKYPRATTWTAEGWPSFERRWYTTPPSSPSGTVLSISPSPSPAASATESAPPSPLPAPSRTPSPAPEPPSKSDILRTRTDIHNGPYVHNGPHPAWLTPAAAVPKQHDEKDSAPQVPSGGPPQQTPPILLPIRSPPNAAAHEPLCQVPPHEGLLYAVKGYPGIFQDRDRAVKVMKSTPGADLFFSHDEREVWAFLQGTGADL